MLRRLPLWGTLLVFLTVSTPPAPAIDKTPTDEEKALINTLMQRQQLIALTDVTDPDHFVADNDPETLQILFQSDPNTKPRVSDDGEFVVMPLSTTISDQSYLTYDAFYRKARRIVAAQKSGLPKQ